MGLVLLHGALVGRVGGGRGRGGHGARVDAIQPVPMKVGMGTAGGHVGLSQRHAVGLVLLHGALVGREGGGQDGRSGGGGNGHSVGLHRGRPSRGAGHQQGLQGRNTVGHAGGDGVLSDQHASLPEVGKDRFLRNTARGGDIRNEDLGELIHQALRLTPAGRGVRGNAFQRALARHDLDRGLFAGAFHGGPVGHHNADRAQNGGGTGNDFVGGAGDPVRGAGGQIADIGGNRFRTGANLPRELGNPAGLTSR